MCFFKITLASVFTLWIICCVESRVVTVNLDSKQAAKENGQYLAKFCFRGQYFNTGILHTDIFGISLLSLKSENPEFLESVDFSKVRSWLQSQIICPMRAVITYK